MCNADFSIRGTETKSVSHKGKTHKNQLQKQCNTISCVSQEISSIYSIFLLLKMALLKKIHQKAQDLQKFGRHLLYIGRTDMVRDSVAGLHALFVP